jgi:O-antigen ligase
VIIDALLALVALASLPLLEVAVAADGQLVSTLAVVMFIAASSALLVRRIRLSSVVVVVLLVSLAFSSLLPTPLALIVQLAAVIIPFVLWGIRFGVRGPTRWVVLAVVVVLAVWTLLLLHPNVPDFITGLEGWRKSVMAIVGLVLGCAVVPRRPTEDAVISVLVVALGVSIVAHLWLPGIEDMVSRDAAVYTGEFEGSERLQGVFAGPFHIAQAAVLVIGWAGVRFRSRPLLAAVAAVVGLVALGLASVRTSFIALAVVVVVLVLVIPLSRRARWIAVASITVVGAASVAAASLGLLGSAAASLFSVTTDGRFLNRFPGYADALEALRQSPLVGWGAGSAGDTLGPQFLPEFFHVTSHNILLKIAVEGGLVGIAAWVFLAVAIWRTVGWSTGAGRVALVSLIGLAVFGVVGSSLEALPVTYFLFVMVGLACSNYRPFRRASSARAISVSQGTVES